MSMTVSDLKDVLTELENQGKGYYVPFIDTFCLNGDGEVEIHSIDVLDIDAAVELNLR